MPLVNVKKKIEKAGDQLGLAPGEEVVAACTTNPSGTMTRMLSRELGGAVGAAVAAARSGDGGAVDAAVDAETGYAGRFPNGQHFLAVTDRRMLVCSVAKLSGKPKELVAEWARDDVAGIEVEPGKLAAKLTVAFVDGTAVQVEGARGTDPGSLAEAWN